MFVHGFACAHSDWDAQVAHLSPRHQTGGVDLRGHGASPGPTEECPNERYGADAADVMRALGLPPAALVGHSKSCRVVVEAASQGPDRATGMILVDGSQSAAGMASVPRDTFAMPNGCVTLSRRWFQEMFTGRSNPTTVASVINRAASLPRSLGEKLLMDLLRCDVGRLATASTYLFVPIMAIQTTYSNAKRER